MKLYLYSVDDGDNVINKTMISPLEINIRLDNGVDVIRPSIRLRDIDGFDFDDYNYAHIDVLGRFYFVDKLERASAKDSILHLVCDVLETYKTELLNSKARVRSNLRNGDYVDVSVDESIVKSAQVYQSDKTLVEGESTIIFTVIGGD